MLAGVSYIFLSANRQAAFHFSNKSMRSVDTVLHLHIVPNRDFSEAMQRPACDSNIRSANIVRQTDLLLGSFKDPCGCFAVLTTFNNVALRQTMEYW